MGTSWKQQKQQKQQRSLGTTKLVAHQAVLGAGRQGGACFLASVMSCPSRAPVAVKLAGRTAAREAGRGRHQRLGECVAVLILLVFFDIFVWIFPPPRRPAPADGEQHRQQRQSRRHGTLAVPLPRARYQQRHDADSCRPETARLQGYPVSTLDTDASSSPWVPWGGTTLPSQSRHAANVTLSSNLPRENTHKETWQRLSSMSSPSPCPPSRPAHPRSIWTPPPS